MHSKTKFDLMISSRISVRTFLIFIYCPVLSTSPLRTIGFFKKQFVDIKCQNQSIRGKNTQAASASSFFHPPLNHVRRFFRNFDGKNPGLQDLNFCMLFENLRCTLPRLPIAGWKAINLKLLLIQKEL